MGLRSEQYVVPPNDFILVASGEVTSDVVVPENCRGLLVGTAGSLNVTMSNGEQRDNVPFVQGITPCFVSTVRVSSGGAQNIWAIV